MIQKARAENTSGTGSYEVFYPVPWIEMRPQWILLASLGFCLSACGAPSTPGQDRVNSQNIRELEQKASAGNPEAIRDVIGYQCGPMGTDVLCERWLDHGVSASEPSALVFKATILHSESREAGSEVQQRALLDLALKHAKTAYERDKERGSQNLIERIEEDFAMLDRGAETPRE